MSDLAISYDDQGTLRLPMSWQVYDSLEYQDELRGAEYMDGELLVPPAAPDWDHQDAALYLIGQLRPSLQAGEGVSTGVAWKPDTVDEEYIPDVIVCSIPADPRRFVGVPLLCVEITSSNWTVDLIRKRAKYAAAGLTDYWIVDRRNRALRCLRLENRLFVDAEIFEFASTSASPVVTASYAGRKVDVELARLFN